MKTMNKLMLGLFVPAALIASQTWARRSAVNGVWPAGLRMNVQPAARAGAALRVTIPAGKFQGVMPKAGPTGSCRTRKRLCGKGAGRTSPPMRRAASA